MTQPDPARTAGPAGDGSRSLAKESKAGLAVSLLVTIVATGALKWLTDLDTSQWSGWWASSAVMAVGTGIGLLTAWLKRNR